MTSDPHHQFRVRIDELTKERDDALKRAAEVTPLRRRLRVLEKSRDYWRDKWLTTGISGRWRKR